MYKVVIISDQEKELVQGKEFTKDSKFNPVKNADGDWCVSIEEVQQSGEEYKFLKRKEVVDYKIPQPEIEI